jgi:hypothetical protein
MSSELFGETPSSAGKYRLRPLILTKTLSASPRARSPALVAPSTSSRSLKVVDPKLLAAVRSLDVRTVAELFGREIAALADVDRSRVLLARERAIAHVRRAPSSPESPRQEWPVIR